MPQRSLWSCLTGSQRIAFGLLTAAFIADVLINRTLGSQSSLGKAFNIVLPLGPAALAWSIHLGVKDRPLGASGEAIGGVTGTRISPLGYPRPVMRQIAGAMIIAWPVMSWLMFPAGSGFSDAWIVALTAWWVSVAVFVGAVIPRIQPG